MSGIKCYYDLHCTDLSVTHRNMYVHTYPTPICRFWQNGICVRLKDPVHLINFCHPPNDTNDEVNCDHSDDIDDHNYVEVEGCYYYNQMIRDTLDYEQMCESNVTNIPEPVCEINVSEPSLNNDGNVHNNSNTITNLNILSYEIVPPEMVKHKIFNDGILFHMMEKYDHKPNVKEHMMEKYDHKPIIEEHVIVNEYFFYLQ